MTKKDWLERKFLKCGYNILGKDYTEYNNKVKFKYYLAVFFNYKSFYGWPELNTSKTTYYTSRSDKGSITDKRQFLHATKYF